jgi:hypothetical protein
MILRWPHAERLTLAKGWQLAPDLADNAEQLVAAVLQPEPVTALVERLDPTAHTLLEQALTQGGVISRGRLEREIGPLDEYYAVQPDYLACLPARNPVQELLYLCLLIAVPATKFTQFAIPADLQALLPIQGRAIPPLQPTPAPAAEQLASPEELETWLVALLEVGLAGQLEMIPHGGLNKTSLQALAKRMGQDPKGISREDYWPYVRFLRHLALAANLLRIGTTPELQVTPQAIEWLKAPRPERMRLLLNSWLQSDWHEMIALYRYQFQYLFTYDLPAIRQTILDFLARCQPGVWYDLSAMVVQIKTFAPDFARPSGVYTRSGIKNGYGERLDGFEAWEKVEGLWITTILSTTLTWLGLVDAGGTEQAFQTFRLTDYGAHLLQNQPAPVEPAVAPLIVQPNFEIIVPAEASLYARFQLNRIAEQVSQKTVTTFRLTKRSVQAAAEHGIQANDIERFLNEQSQAPPPQNVLVSLREWSEAHGQIRLRQGVLLETDDPALLALLQHDRRLRLANNEQLNERTMLIHAGDAAGLAERIRKAGYGVDNTIDQSPLPLSENDLATLLAVALFYADASKMVALPNHVSGALLNRLDRLLSQTRRERAALAASDMLKQLRKQIQAASDDL